MGSFDLGQWLLIAFFVFLAYKMLSGRKGQTMYCTACGVEAPTASKTRGSMAIEIFLWLCFIFPGVIYSLWRMSSRSQVCSSCGSSHVIPPESPLAIRAKRDSAT